MAKYAYPTPPNSRRKNRRRAISIGATLASGSRNRYVRAIGRGAKIAVNLSRKFDKMKVSNMKKKGGHKKWHNGSTAKYVGGFARPSKSAKAITETQCLRNGYHCTSEIYGRIEDQHCVYVSHSTYHRELIARAICGSLLRKLFKVAGISVNNRMQELPLNSFTNSSGFQISYVIYEPTIGSYVGYNHVIVDDKNFTAVLNDFTQFTGHISSYMLGDDISGLLPYSLSLSQADDNIAITNYRLVSKLDLTSEHITLHVSSNLKVQNRTAGDNAIPEDNEIRYASDRIDNQPLKGYIYQFSNSDPRLRNPQTHPNLEENLLSRASEYGITLVRANQVAQRFEEPPVPKAWSNLSSSSRISLQPGDLKNTFLSHTFSGYLNTVLRSLRCSGKSLIAGGYVLSGIAGKCQMIAMEEILRTAGTNPITLQYEREVKVGCIPKTKIKNHPLISDLSTAVIDSVPV